MNYRYDFDNKKKTNKRKIIAIVLFSILVIVFASLFFNSSKNPVISTISNVISYPIKSIYSFGENIISNVSNYFGNVKKLNEENDKQKEKNKELELKLIETQSILDENETLKKMLNITKKFQHYELKNAKIIYREHDNFTQTFKIDLGKNDGIKINQAVIHEEGLVGYISALDDFTSIVTTILDPSSSVSVNISTINEPAILKGDLALKSENKLKLEFIPLDAQVSISDMLYTSGLGATYKSSIPVGKIIEVINSKNDMNRYAIVEPNVNIRTISEVCIIIN